MHQKARAKLRLIHSPANFIPHPQVCLAWKNLRASEATYFHMFSPCFSVLVTLPLHCHLSSHLRNKNPPSFPWLLPPVHVLLMVAPPAALGFNSVGCLLSLLLSSVLPNILIPSPLYITVLKIPSPKKILLLLTPPICNIQEGLQCPGLLHQLTAITPSFPVQELVL